MTPLTEEARRLLDEVQVAFVAMTSTGSPYVLPTSFARDGDVVYLHGGPGKKADALAADARVCLAVTGETVLTKGVDACGDNFTYRSALIYGEAVHVQDDLGRERGLRALARKYHPEAAEAPFRAETLSRTLVYALAPTEITWKDHGLD